MNGAAPPVAARRTRYRAVAVYTALVVAPVAGTAAVLLSVGDAAWRETAGPALPALPLLARTLLAVAVVIAVCRALGALALRFGQPPVIGEIAGGIVLGPSLLQTVWPGAGDHVFTAEVVGTLDVVAQLGVVLFVFVAGLELRPRALAGSGGTALVVSHVGMAVPLLCGVVLAVAVHGRFAPDGVAVVPFALFIGVALSITALPVLARILRDSGWLGTRVGTLAMTCAMVDDVTAWCLLAVVLSLSGAGSAAGIGVTIVATALLAAALLLLGRGLARAPAWDRRVGLPAALVALFVVAAAAEWSGVHAIFGAFLLGVVIPADSALARRVHEGTGLLGPLLLPVFFALSGLRTDITALGTDPVLWGWCLLVLVVACGGKLIAAGVAARAMGMGRRDAVCVGGLMNCRGLTELIVLNVGLTLGVIDTTLFTMLVIMALVSTAMAAPLLGRRPDPTDATPTGPDDTERTSMAPSTPSDGGRGRRVLDEVIARASDADAAAVRAWATHGTTPGSGEVAAMADLLADHEHGGRRLVDDLPRPDSADPRAIRSVGVIGGGTAGYLTALALRAKRPWLDVTLVESPSMPIIGVGEATTPSMVPFLHHYLGVDPAELYERVRPTWKMGIRFDWGANPDGFMAPFDWNANSVGILGSLREQGDINAFTLQSLYMRADRVPVFRLGDRYATLLDRLPYAYHLDNERFVRYLTELAERRGVRHVQARLADVVKSADDWIDHVRTTDGETLEFDFWVDCTGFRSMLLGKALGTPFTSYADSLFCDSAVTGNVDHGGVLKPYTTATTMNAGWRWTIPTPESDHLGYVFASGALSDEEAAAELARSAPGVTEPRFVRFRVGRHHEAWRGNVMGVGNSYAFVEPLESSGLMMITLEILALVSSLPASWSEPCARDVVNQALAQKWDAMRWFLTLHYRFNDRLDTPFWRDARERSDVSGLRPLLDAFATGAPLRFRDAVTRGFLESAAPTFYGLEGVDCLLLGQKVPTRLLPATEPHEAWRRRKAGADALVRQGVGQREALDAFAADPALHAAILDDPGSWVSASGTDRLVRNEEPSFAPPARAAAAT
ncbi:FAD-dependent oxidoreductase [Marinitenerispora sediminis]|uniref:Cation/H+ exchanger transmembrane domain-containing protein n=1 Tax=Marinitenerispora sediminis TaxID=1931232 RepID=A0A368T958_9ACTN|nr:FAD-dependent oxidoreductase [Marinitenerispora sediminis]RCV52080.1 hypothetical protein DEF28_14010 [Marinitenerispora sediminis]RCV58099.1 hypothetical protein DEF23_09655 [Marinitenerispora sediminis]RCV60839.1 hypothetical protein DEF24_05875 [Marinitenerispora sediminis]